MSRAEDEGMQGHAPWLADPVQSETPAGLLPVSARGKHEIEAAGGWVVACGAYDEYGCMPTEARDYIVATLNARAASQERPQPHAHPFYDCGGKGHGPDVSEVQWCHDCTPHHPPAPQERPQPLDHPRTYSLVGSPYLFLVTDDESGINIGYANKIGGPLVARPLASQERPPIDVGRLGWVIYEMGIDDLNLPDAEKLAAHILSRLSGSVGECKRFRHDEHCADEHWKG